jgi:hypothetical protein
VAENAPGQSVEKPILPWVAAAKRVIFETRDQQFLFAMARSGNEVLLGAIRSQPNRFGCQAAREIPNGRHNFLDRLAACLII